ncbi:hypothetical protein [Rhizobium halophytocola]|uniref:Uncharacterized protein n=1 Tax=Rhizobium halophytocola TaxID=735519 RepID=A0ABS4E6A1_9HYPH|nr:hypothetical protein [Rhizobium halophytocola]MBP1853466.1 hypothetical protein [Rhizobium halophytocola]
MRNLDAIRIIRDWRIGHDFCPPAAGTQVKPAGGNIIGMSKKK